MAVKVRASCRIIKNIPETRRNWCPAIQGGGDGAARYNTGFAIFGYKGLAVNFIQQTVRRMDHATIRCCASASTRTWRACRRTCRTSRTRIVHVLQGHHRRHRRPGLRLQAADRLFRRARRRRPARGNLHLPARDLSAHPADPRRQARRHRRHRAPVRARSVRPLRRRRGHRQSLHGLRFGRAVHGLARPRRDRAVPHVERGRLRPAVPGRRRQARCTSTWRDWWPTSGTATASARWWSGATFPEELAQVRAHRRRHAAAGAGRRRAGRRCRGDCARRQARPAAPA